MRRCISVFLCMLIILSVSLCGCTGGAADESISLADTSGMDFGFDEEDTAGQTESTEIGTVEYPVDENDLNITSGGSYTLTGTHKDMMVVVDALDADVQLILDGVIIENSKGPAIYVRSAGKVQITLKDGSSNTLSDGTSYDITDSDSTLDGAVFSKADLTVNGSGTLTVNGNYKHGIVSKDDLVISSGTIMVNAQSTGINGKDCVKVNNGNITVTSGGDGIKSDNDTDADRGYVYLYGGTVNITSGNDGIQAQTVLKIEDVDLMVTAGGGSDYSLSSSAESYKGLKASSDILISGGSFDITSRDDCIHSNGTITISGGTYTLASGDDGIHADTDLAISGNSTKLTVTKSYEGIEGTGIVISGGDISIVADDDGINAAGGNNGSTGRFGQGSFSSSTGKIVISGGTLYIKASGDGLDANGTLSVTAGDITVSGPNSGDTSILDYDASGTISGGTFVGAGAAGMAQNFSSSSTQGCILANVGNQSAGSVIKLTDSDGNVITRHTTDQAFSCIILSHPSIKQGSTYTLSAGSFTTTITMTSTVYGSSNAMGGGMNGPMGGGKGAMGGMGPMRR